MSFVNDTFTDLNLTDLESHTGETGATWTKHATTSGNMRINNDGSTSTAFATASASVMYYASGSPASAEYDVESLGVKRIGPTAVNFAFLAGRMDTAAATVYVAGFDFASSSWIIQKRVAGASTTLSTLAGTWPENGFKDLKFEIRDAYKKLFADGVEVGSTTDNTITAAGKVGIRAAGGSETYALFNNFTATDAGAGPSPTLVTVANSVQPNTSSAGTVSQSATTFVSAANSAQGNIVSAGAIATTAAGTITLPEFRDWGTGNLLPNETGVTAWVSDATTGVLVVKLTGLSSNASAVCTLSHASIVAGTAYYVRAKRSNGAEAGWTFTAS